jgi:hypothetical protein
VWQDIEQAALAFVEYLRYTRYRFGEQLSVTDNAQASRLFGNQHVTTRQPGHGPGLDQIFSYRYYTVAVASGGIDITGLGVCGQGSSQQQSDNGGKRKNFMLHSYLRSLFNIQKNPSVV